jgi:hypothetical protein
LRLPGDRPVDQPIQPIVVERFLQDAAANRLIAVLATL